MFFFILLFFLFFLFFFFLIVFSLYARRHRERNNGISGTTRIRYNWLPPHVRYLKTSVELHGVRQLFSPFLLPFFQFFNNFPPFTLFWISFFLLLLLFLFPLSLSLSLLSLYFFLTFAEVFCLASPCCSTCSASTCFLIAARNNRWKFSPKYARSFVRGQFRGIATMHRCVFTIESGFFFLCTPGCLFVLRRFEDTWDGHVTTEWSSLDRVWRIRA